jgi:AraC family transcriptional regulator
MEARLAREVQPGAFDGAWRRAAWSGAFDIASFEVRPRGQVVEPHTHAEPHFVLAHSGVYSATLNGRPTLVRAPFLIFYPAGTTHADCFDGNLGAFVSVTLRADAGTHGLPDTATAIEDPAAHRGAFRIAREVLGAGRDAVVLEDAAWELAAHTAGPARAAPTPPWARVAYATMMDRAREQGLSVADVAKAAGVHPVHLARVFRQAWGCSPGELLRWRRVERAAELVLRGRLTLAGAAVEVGFADQAHMTRAFRTVLGLTPGAWRRAHDVAPIQDASLSAA